MSTYGVIYEQAPDGSWSARAADLPVFAAGSSQADTEREIRAAIALYLDELRASGAPAPEPQSLVGTVRV